MSYSTVFKRRTRFFFFQGCAEYRALRSGHFARSDSFLFAPASPTAIEKWESGAKRVRAHLDGQVRCSNRVESGDNTGEINQMLKTDTIQITPDLLALLTDIDEFKGAWRALGNLAPDRSWLSAVLPP